MGGPKKMYHVKFKSKISYLGEKISILPRQMAEQLAVEVDVKNMTEQQYIRTSPFILFGYLVTKTTGPYNALLRRALGGPSGTHWGPFGPPPPHKIV